MALKKKLGIGLRVVVVQLESHQAAVVGGKDFMAEPLVNSDKGFVLDRLTRKGLDQFATLKESIKAEYIAWQRQRVLSVLDYVKDLPHSTSLLNHCEPNPVLLVVFPEYSIPFELMPDIRNWIDEFQRYQIAEFNKATYQSGGMDSSNGDPAVGMTVQETSDTVALANGTTDTVGGPSTSSWIQSSQTAIHPNDISRSESQKKQEEPKHKLPWTVVVVAGTHTLPPPTKENLAIYTETLKVDMNHVFELYKSKLPTKSVAPVLYLDVTSSVSDSSPIEDKTLNKKPSSTRYDIKTKLKLKRILSPFELTNMGIHTDEVEKIKDDVVSVPISLSREVTSDQNGLHLSILPLVCSEALQSTAYGEADYDILVIPAYQKEDRSFQPIIEQVSRNQRVVVLSNDGRYGGSAFKIPTSVRGDSWWLGEPNNGKLPKGDGIIVADLTPLSLAEESQVNNPAERCQILRLSAVVPDDIENDSYIVARILERLRERESQCSKEHRCCSKNPVGVRPIDVNRRKRILKDCLERDVTGLQRIKIQRLMSIPFIDDDLWKLHGTDVIASLERESQLEPSGQPSAIKRRATSPERPQPFLSLRSFEKQLARKCVSMIDTIREANDLTEEQYEALGTSRQICRSLAKRDSDKERNGRGLKLVESANEFLKKLSSEHNKLAHRLLAEQTAELVEKFQAASAWLLVNVEETLLHPDLATAKNDFPLICVVAHNATPCRPLNTSNSMAARCLKLNQPVIEMDIRIRQGYSNADEFYPVKPTTRSAIAVPLKLPYASQGTWWPSNNSTYDSPYSICSGRQLSSNSLDVKKIDQVNEPVIGVLVLESTQPFGLGPIQAIQLESESKILCEALNFVRSVKVAGKSRFLTLPAAIDWNLSPTLSSLCYSMSTTVPSHSNQPAFGMTIWRADIARQTIAEVGQEYDFVYEVYAQGFVRFDAEYVAHQSLPWVEMTEWPRNVTQASDQSTTPSTPLSVSGIAELPAAAGHKEAMQGSTTSKPKRYAKLELANEKIRFRPASFVGSVVLSEGDGYVAKSWRSINNYRRQDKGKRTELDHIFAVRIMAMHGSTGNESMAVGGSSTLRSFPQLDNKLIQANCDVLKGLDVEKQKSQEQLFRNHVQTCWGAITIYTYSGTTTDLSPFFSQPAMAGLSALISRFIDDAHHARVEAAIARIRYLCQLEAITSVNAFNIIREWMMKVFDADGCSIFARNSLSETQDVGVHCVTTSGLQRYGHETPRSEAFYTFDKDSKADQVSLTRALFTNDETDSLRLNSRSDHVRASPPPNRFVEAYVLTWLEHRRNMFHKVVESVGNNEPVTSGLVRLVRSTSKPPFTPEDEFLLRVICKAIAQEFSHRRLFRENQLIPQITSRISTWAGIPESGPTGNNATGDDAVTLVSNDVNDSSYHNRICMEMGHNEETKAIARNRNDAEKRSELYREVCQRLMIGDPRTASFGSRSIASILQDAFFAFDDALPVLAMFRFLSTNDQGQNILKVHSYHAHSSNSLTEDHGDLPVSEFEGGIGWRAIMEKKPIEFQRSAEGFTKLFPFQEKMRFGICLPMVIPLKSHIVVGSFSVECKGTELHSELLERHVTLASLACIQIALRASQLEFQRPENKTFDYSGYSSVKQRENVVWYSPIEELSKCVDREFPDSSSMFTQSRFSRLPPKLVWMARDLQYVGAKINITDGVCQLPLWFGCTVLGNTIIKLDFSKEGMDKDLNGTDKNCLQGRFQRLYEKSVAELALFLKFCAGHRHKLQLTAEGLTGNTTRQWKVSIGATVDVKASNER